MAKLMLSFDGKEIEVKPYEEPQITKKDYLAFGKWLRKADKLVRRKNGFIILQSQLFNSLRRAYDSPRRQSKK